MERLNSSKLVTISGTKRLTGLSSVDIISYHLAVCTRSSWAGVAVDNANPISPRNAILGNPGMI